MGAFPRGAAVGGLAAGMVKNLEGDPGFPGRSAGIVAGSLLALLTLDAHQQALGAGILDAVDELAALMDVAQRLGDGDAGLDQERRAHGEVGLDPDVDGSKQDADGNHRDGGEERRIGEGDPGTGVLADLSGLGVHDGVSLCLRLSRVSKGVGFMPRAQPMPRPSA